ncbi:Clavaminate synthase-like protein [Aspergillus steynii IBT 23096]|uniref:Clavaminate synthase-like protein n=1 Tax=Aspergillus steynii IBT 23096 TaxID=1392250 RepID=A0A2I2FU85_9EURO|nr:Clavaminate synthase-like protein [Aspergillus steynii IBT 23096]PLB44208.1 Clavaminate synthase-like protein [Aspergillus steynii IBT 23096]
MSTTTRSDSVPSTTNASSGKIVLSQGITRELSTSNAGNFTSIPVIDLRPLTSPTATATEKKRMVSEIRDACIKVGFFVIKNHGIDWNIVDAAFDALEEFFGLPLENKMKIHQSTSPSYMGYEEPYYTNIDGLSKGDSKESVYISYDPYLDPLGVGDAMPKILKRDNLWPDPQDAPKFRPAIEAYRASCLDLMRKMIRVLALAMGEEETFFDKKTTYPIATIRAIHYPPQEGSAQEEIGLGAHTDIQMMTMIAQRPYYAESLEVLNAAGQWVKPKLEPETFVVNLGDMVGRLTNDVFQSTVHRVCNTAPEGKVSQNRYSMPFFFGMNNDELVTTLPQFATEENPLNEQYLHGMTGYEHYNRRLQRAHHKHPSAINSASTALPPGMTKVNGILVSDM